MSKSPPFNKDRLVLTSSRANPCNEVSLTVRGDQMLRQMFQAEEAMNRVLEKAREMGCEIYHDEIICTVEQARELGVKLGD